MQNVLDPGRPFSMQADMQHPGSGTGLDQELILFDNPDSGGYPTVYFCDIDVQKVGSTNALEQVQLCWKDSTPTYYVIKDTAADWQGSGMRQVAPVPGCDIVVRMKRNAAGAATGVIILAGANLF